LVADELAGHPPAKRELLIFVWPGLLATGYAASMFGGPVAQQGLPGHLQAPRS
jgi:hypothetical protein